jgi:hypothetical protein
MHQFTAAMDDLKKVSAAGIRGAGSIEEYQARMEAATAAVVTAIGKLGEPDPLEKADLVDTKPASVAEMCFYRQSASQRPYWDRPCFVATKMFTPDRERSAEGRPADATIKPFFESKEMPDPTANLGDVQLTRRFQQP